MNIFRYVKQTNVVENQHQNFDKTVKPDEKEKPPTIKKEKLEITGELNVLYDSKHSFSEYRNISRFYDISLDSKYHKLLSFFID